jgi:putative membrane-bound dehydrogenase-like protein
MELKIPMKSWSRFLFLAPLLLAPAVARAQVAPDKALSTFKVHSDGLELSLWASEEVGGFCNPTCIDVDHKGRVWVCESVNYRYTLHHQPPRRPEGDRILILEDTKGDGKADKCTVFYQSPEILAPLGIAVAKDPVGPGYKVFVCQSPDILVFTDKEGKGKADGPPTKLLTGFGGIDHDHGVHGILIGPDMKLYFSVGDPGGVCINGLQSSDGKGRKWTSNETDCRAGTIWRCELDGTKLELLADNFRNEYEPCVDSFGTIFTSDNDDDGNQQTRICYVMPGGDYGYHPRGAGQTHWHEEKPGVVPKVLRTYFGAPTGMCFYEGTLLPKKYWGQPLHTDAGPREVRCYHLTPDGAGYDVLREDMVTSTDNWFRPSDICIGPDGSAYIADWYDPGVGGHGIGDFTRGRIYRLAPKRSKPNAPKVDLESKEGLTAALASPNLATRYMAMAKLKTLEQKPAIDLLEAAAAQKENPVLRARALWQLGKRGPLQLFSNAMRLFGAAFEDKDPRFRVVAMRILKDTQENSPADFNDSLKDAILQDPSAQVRREALLLLRDVNPVKAKTLIYALAKQYDGKDRFYLEAIGIAVGHFDKARRDVILADFDKEFPQWNDKVADLVWELQPPSVLPTLGKRIADKSLTPAQRGRIVDILAVADSQAGGAALLKVLETDVPQEVRDKVIDNLKLFLPGKWQGLRGSKDLAESIHNLLNKPETRITGMNLIAAAEKTDALGEVAKFTSNPKETDAVRLAAVQTLGALPSNESAAALGSVLAGDSPALRGAAAQALGQLAQRKADQPGATQALTTLQNAFANKDQNTALRDTAASALAGTRPGSAWLLHLEEKKQLPDALRNDVARLLRNSPYPDLQNKALVLFPPPAKIDPKKLPSIAVLVKRHGDAEKGKKLLEASAKNDMQCLKCHTIHGVGGQVGPDLSVIGKKASRENLYESILYPSKAIADQYLQWKIDKVDGISLSGLIVNETPTSITLRDANAKDTKIDKKDIDTKTKSAVSLMPENIIAYLNEDDLTDIVEYLFSLKTGPEPEQKRVGGK